MTVQHTRPAAPAANMNQETRRATPAIRIAFCPVCSPALAWDVSTNGTGNSNTTGHNTLGLRLGHQEGRLLAGLSCPAFRARAASLQRPKLFAFEHCLHRRLGCLAARWTCTVHSKLHYGASNTFIYPCNGCACPCRQEKVSPLRIEDRSSWRAIAVPIKPCVDPLQKAAASKLWLPSTGARNLTAQCKPLTS